jgi:nucleoside-diphosphate-sugar epimerase
MTTIREVVTRLVALIDPSARPEFGALPERPSEDYRVADIRRTFALLGWQPSIPLDEGLPRTVDWYRSHGSSTDTSPQRLPAAVERWT